MSKREIDYPDSGKELLLEIVKSTPGLSALDACLAMVNLGLGHSPSWDVIFEADKRQDVKGVRNQRGLFLFPKPKA